MIDTIIPVDDQIIMPNYNDDNLFFDTLKKEQLISVYRNLKKSYPFLAILRKYQCINIVIGSSPQLILYIRLS